MRAAYAVAAHLFEYLQLALYGTLIGCCAQAAQVVVVADTVYAYMLTVQKESAVGTELYFPDSERGFICVNLCVYMYGSSTLHRCGDST